MILCGPYASRPFPARTPLLRAHLRRISARRMAQAFAMARGARAQVQEVGA